MGIKDVYDGIPRSPFYKVLGMKLIRHSQMTGPSIYPVELVFSDKDDERHTITIGDIRTGFSLTYKEGE